MIALIERHSQEIAALCQRFHVARLDLFGSAARETDFTNASDIDLLVEYQPGAAPPFSEFFEFREALSRLLGRTVDLTMASAIKNPYLRAGIENNRETVHGS